MPSGQNEAIHPGSFHGSGMLPTGLWPCLHLVEGESQGLWGCVGTSARQQHPHPTSPEDALKPDRLCLLTRPHEWCQTDLICPGRRGFLGHRPFWAKTGTALGKLGCLVTLTHWMTLLPESLSKDHICPPACICDWTPHLKSETLGGFCS